MNLSTQFGSTWTSGVGKED